MKRESMKGNQNAALKPGELPRIQWTETLSGEILSKFAAYHQIDPALPEKEVKQLVIKAARALLEQAIKSQLGL